MPVYESRIDRQTKLTIRTTHPLTLSTRVRYDDVSQHNPRTSQNTCSPRQDPQTNLDALLHYPTQTEFHMAKQAARIAALRRPSTHSPQPTLSSSSVPVFRKPESVTNNGSRVDHPQNIVRSRCTCSAVAPEPLHAKRLSTTQAYAPGQPIPRQKTVPALSHVSSVQLLSHKDRTPLQLPCTPPPPYTMRDPYFRDTRSMSTSGSTHKGRRVVHKLIKPQKKV
jgi:hypothetical protein